MKRLISILLMLFCFFQVKAEEPVSAEYRAAFQTYWDYENLSSHFTPLIEESISYLKQPLTSEQIADIKKASLEKLFDLMVSVWMQYIPLEDLNKMNAFQANPQNRQRSFFSTPEGAAMFQEKMLKMETKLEEAGYRWTEWTVQYIFEVSSKK